MHATAVHSSEERAHGRHDHIAQQAPDHSASVRHQIPAAVLQRKAGCACGGGCPKCRAAAGRDESSALHDAGTTPSVSRMTNVIPLQTKLTVNTPGDAHEQEADRVADQVMRMPDPGGDISSSPHVHAGGNTPPVQRACAACGGARSSASSPEEDEMMQAKESPGAAPKVSAATAGQIGSLRGGGQALPASERSFFEPRFGHDFSNIRIHTDARAADTARAVSAQAYTIGNDVVFGAGHYAPETDSGRRLLAHELTHTIQQGASAPREWTSTATQGIARVQRTPTVDIQRAATISIVDENFVGPLATNQRRAAKSCPINCCRNKLGTLHAMPLFYSASRGAIVSAGSAAATGIGAELHFIKESTQPPAGDICHCDDFRMIQIITSNVPADSRGKNNFVDNNASATPFYGDTYLSGRGEHTIDPSHTGTPRFTDGGERVDTTESIYDIPYRNVSSLGTTDFSWMAETCVACIKNSGPDRILGCVTYGFTRHYNTTTSSFDPVVAVSPSCLSAASLNFTSTLSTDSSTTTYDFLPTPDAIDCGEPGDYPLPRGDTRYA